MSARPLSAVLLVVCLTYAIVRYVLFKGVPPEHIPLYIANKASALAGLIVLGWASLTRDPIRRRSLGHCGWGLVLLHVLASCAMLTPKYFPDFFVTDGRMTLLAELSMVCGMAGTVLLARMAFASAAGEISDKPYRGFGQLVLVLSAVHLIAMGYRGWLQPETWPGGLPPMTLLGALSAAGALALRRWQRVTRPESETSQCPSHRPRTNSDVAG